MEWVKEWISNRVPDSYPVAIDVFWGWEKIGGRDEGKIATSRFRSLETCRSFCFLKGNGTFLVFFFCSVSFETFIYLLLTLKTGSRKYFYAFSRVLVVSPAWLMHGKLRIPGKAWTISMVLFIVNCGLKVGNAFLYIFSRFLSFTDSRYVWLLMFALL